MKFLISFWDFSITLESYGIDLLTKTVIRFLMSIRWTYPVFWVEQLIAVKNLKIIFRIFLNIKRS